MTDIHGERYPLIAQQKHTRTWLQIQGNLGLAANTVEAYGRALAGYLRFCQNQGITPETASREQLSCYVHDLISRPNPRGTKIRVLDSGVGLANAPLQQYLTAVRLWYDSLIEESIRETNPVGRGRYTPGKGFSGARDRGLIPRYKKLPWLPSEEQWRAILEAAKGEPLRNRLMLAIAYDAGLRREELCALFTGDIDPAHRMIRVRAETTKNMMERMVPYSEATAALYAAYLQERRLLRWMEGHRGVKLVLGGEDRIPLVAFSLDGTRLDLALDLTMQFDLDVSNLRKMQALANDLVATLRVREAIIAVTALEPGVAGVLSVLDTTGEGIKRFIEPSEDILLHLRVDVLILFSQLFESWELVSLHTVGDGHSTQLIGISTFLESSVVQLFAAAQHPFECPDLLLGWIDTELVCLASHIRVLGLLRTFHHWWCVLSGLGHGLRCSFWLFLMCSESAVKISPWIER